MKIIAESAFNHNGDKDYLVNLAIESQKSGADYFTFQVMDVDDFCVEDYSKYELYKKYSLSFEDFDYFFEKTKNLGLEYIPCVLDVNSFKYIYGKGYNFLKIHATDISTKTLQIAHTGIYKEERIKDLPIDLKKKYYLKSKDKVSKQVRLKPNIRSKVKFDVLNLMDRVYNTPDEYDIIFCRNVLIYFNKDIQAQVISRLVDRLKKGGILFIGHSESLMGMNLPLELVKPTIFRKLQ